MSSTEIINHVNTTLYNILRESLRPLAPDLNITFGSPADEDTSGDTAPKLLVFLYNIIEDPFSRNRPDEYRGGGNRLLSFKRPLAVNLYYMLTPFSGPSSSTDVNARIRVQGHNIIALAMRAFNDNGLINPRFFPSDTTLGEWQVRVSPVHMNLEEITKIWSSFNKPYRLSVCYEVSIIRVQSEKIPKEVHVVERATFSSGTGGSEGEFEVVPAIGRRNLLKLKDKGWNLNAIRSSELGGISNVRPVAVQPGMALSIYGRNFKDKKLRVKIGDKIITDGRRIDEAADQEVDKAIHDSQEINETLLRTLLKTLLGRLLGSATAIDEAQVDQEVDKAIHDSQEINETLLRTLLKTLLGRLLGTSFRVISDNLIKIKISANEEPGPKKLSLAAAEEEEEEKEEEDEEEAALMATFEVLPPEPRLITITEVRPDKGISGDLITVYGINITEDAKVSIGNTEVTKVTFVDSSQINIMVPPGMASAMTRLNVKTDQGKASTQFRIL